jgi:phage shock protein A
MSEYAEFNDENMTYAPVRNLGREVAELEAQRRQLQIDYAQLKAERDELEAKLNAAIVSAVYQEVQHG